MKGMLRWGLLSTARINRAVIAPMRTLDRHELVAVASREADRAEAYALEWGIPRSYGSYDELIADPAVTAIYNPLPNSLHAEWTIRAVEAGKHVLCEKPLALSVDEVDAMAAASARAGVVVAEAFMYRHHPQTLQLKALVDSGTIGPVQLIRGSFSFSLTRDGDVRLFTGLGGGSLWDVGCYPVSMSRFIAGTEPRRVMGFQRLGVSGIDECFYGHLDFGGLHAQFDCGFCAPYRTHLEVVGSSGAIAVPTPFKPGLATHLVLTRDSGTETITAERQELYAGELEDFADAVLLGRPPRISLQDSRATVATLVALYESARLGRPIHM